MRFINHIRSKDGSLTIEAAIAMPAFIFVILGMAFFMRVIYIYSIMQHAINDTSNTLSTYSYIYSITLKEHNDTLDNYLNPAKEEFEEHISEVIGGYYSITDALNSNSQNEGEEIYNFSQVQDDIEKYSNIFKDIKDNPKNELKGFIYLMADGAFNDAKTSILKPMIRLFIGKYLKTETLSEDQRLKNFNVIDGIEGLDFSESKVLKDKKT